MISFSFFTYLVPDSSFTFQNAKLLYLLFSLIAFSHSKQFVMHQRMRYTENDFLKEIQCCTLEISLVGHVLLWLHSIIHSQQILNSDFTQHKYLYEFLCKISAYLQFWLNDAMYNKNGNILSTIKQLILCVDCSFIVHHGPISSGLNESHVPMCSCGYWSLRDIVSTLWPNKVKRYHS